MLKKFFSNLFSGIVSAKKDDASYYYQKFDSDYDAKKGLISLRTCLDYKSFPFYASFPNRLKNIRTFHKKTQTEVAKAIGISNNMLSSYETYASTPKPETLNKISAYYNVPLSFIKNACAGSFEEQLELCRKYEEEFANSIAISTRAAYKYFYSSLTEREKQLCRIVNEFFELGEETPNEQSVTTSVPEDSYDNTNDTLDFKCKSKNPLLKGWSKWSLSHNSELSINRRKYSFGIKTLFMDEELLYGYFSSGFNKIRKASLIDCTCSYFETYKTPCEHMYRLFYLLEYGDLDKKCLDIKLEYIQALSILSADAAFDFSEIYNNTKNKGFFYSRKRNPIKELIDNSLIIQSKEKDYKQLLDLFTKKELIQVFDENNIIGYKPYQTKNKLIEWVVSEHLEFVKKRYSSYYSFKINDEIFIDSTKGV